MSKKDKDDLAEHEKKQEDRAPEPGMTPREPEQPPPHEVKDPVENLEEREHEMDQEDRAPEPGITPREPEPPPSKD